MTPISGEAGLSSEPLARATKSILRRLLEIPAREGRDEKGGPRRKEVLLPSENPEVTDRAGRRNRLGAHLSQLPTSSMNNMSAKGTEV